MSTPALCLVFCKRLQLSVSSRAWQIFASDLAGRKERGMVMAAGFRAPAVSVSFPPRLRLGNLLLWRQRQCVQILAVPLSHWAGD